MERYTVRRQTSRGPIAPPRLDAKGGGPPATSGMGQRAGLRNEGERPPTKGEAPEFGGGVYVISVAARLLGMHPQTLRKYERVGLVRPTRSIGMLRLYSVEDVVRVRMIKYMVDSLGMNLAGVEFVLSVLNRIEGLSERLQTMSQENDPHQLLARELEVMLTELRALFPESPQAT